MEIDATVSLVQSIFMKRFLLIVLLLVVFKSAEAQLCKPFWHYFKILDKNAKPIANKSEGYWVLSYKNRFENLVYPLGHLIEPCEYSNDSCKSDGFDWVVFECGYAPRNYMFIQVVDKNTKDTMKVLYKKVDGFQTYEKEYGPSFDTIAFAKGNFFIDAKLGRPTYKDWLSHTKPIMKLSSKEWDALIKVEYKKYEATPAAILPKKENR
jgi:hypothetical protein